MKDKNPRNRPANTKKTRAVHGRARRRDKSSTARTGLEGPRWLIPDDVADTIVAELRELENAAHE